MSESKAYERRIGKPARCQPRGQFRDNADDIGVILPAYRQFHTRGYYAPNDIHPHSGKPLPRKAVL